MNARRIAAAFCVVVVLLVGACGAQLKDSSFTNPEWRASFKSSVTFPLSQEVVITVGLSSRMGRPGPDNASLDWLRKRTNIRLEFAALPDSPGDVELGELVRSGRLPDIIPEDRIDLADEYARRLFVNVAEFRGLIPRFLERIAADPELLRGSLARTTEKGELFSVGTYRRDTLPYAGVLAYRRDLFEGRNLATSSWEGIATSLGALKSAFPESVPFGGVFGSMLRFMPSWFGSGYDPENVVYWDPARSAWVFGPDEDAFRDFVAFVADLYRRGLLNPDSFLGQEDTTGEQFTRGSVFMAPWVGATGPFFPYAAEGYGKLTDTGEWDETGAWVDALPLPPRQGKGARAAASMWSRVGGGWLVYNQSPRAAEAVALLDLMYDPEVSVALALGPEGMAWERAGGKIRLAAGLAESYATGSVTGVRKALADRGTNVGADLGGEAWSFFDHLGFPTSAPYRYYATHDLARNRPGLDLTMQPGVRVPSDASFREARVMIVVSLKTAIEGGVANFVVGRKPMAEYDAFRADLRKTGADKLLELYRTRAVPVGPAVLLPPP